MMTPIRFSILDLVSDFTSVDDSVSGQVRTFGVHREDHEDSSTGERSQSTKCPAHCPLEE